MPLRLLGAWHLVSAGVGLMTIGPALALAVRHPVGWLTLALIAVTALIGVALFAGVRRVLPAAALLQGAQMLALSLPGLVTWIVRVGVQVSLSVPPMRERGLVTVRHDTTVVTIWGTAAQLPLGVSVNVLALLAFALCLTLLPDRAEALQPDSV